MKKRILTLALALVIVLGVSAFPARPALAAAPLSAKPTASTVLVNGENVAFDAYNINDNNYFKLRDLAFTLNGTVKQFAVGWDGDNNAISLTSGQGYAPDGSEMKSKGAGNKTPSPTTSKIYLDGKDVQFTAYNIEGNNYFKLRDIGEAFDFGVTWDGARNTIVIDTSIGYTPEGSAQPETTTETPSGGDTGLVWPGDNWYTGLRLDSYASSNSYLWLEFYPNGEFEYLAHWTDLIVGTWPNQRGGDAVSDAFYKGTYSASNGNLTLVFKSAQYRDSDTKWNYTDIAVPATLTLPYKLQEDRYEERDYWDVVTETRVYHELDIGGPLPGANGSAEYGRDFHNDGYLLRLKEENANGGAIIYAEKNPSNFSWTGKWESDYTYYGTFDLVQNGNSVNGKCDAGSFSGTVTDNTLNGICDGREGKDELLLTMSPDGNGFSMLLVRQDGSFRDLDSVAVRAG